MLGAALALLIVLPATLPRRYGDPTELALEAGRRALAAGEKARAAEHFRAALVHSPASVPVLELLLEAVADDPEARGHWSLEYALAALGESGELSFEARRPVQSEAWAIELALARASAFGEVATAAAEHQKKSTRAPEELCVAQWLRRAARELAWGSAVLEQRAAALSPELVLPDGFHEPVLSAVQKALTSALAARRTGDAIRLARVLTGLATQAGFEDLQGERPSGLERAAEAGAQGLAKARAELLARGEKPWSVDELAELSDEEAEAFTRQHASFGDPGVALSPRGWYRVETDCGARTLLGVAETVELHHERLARWYGKDPFVGEQGTLRVVHEAADLEAEGAPFFWVGGFQSGATTTGRFACGTIEGFGHLLTHELTHRFDGALYPGQPAWLSEGKAVWTGGAYGHSTDQGFVPNHASFGTVEATFIKGYGSLDKLERLIAGTLEDYRDNYVAGYALYLYLSSWQENGRPLYRERLQAFMEGGRQTKLGPKERFEACFCDGKEGRPAKLSEFAERFGEYVSGFYWKTPKPWTAMYTQEVPSGPSDGWVYDEPTWTWSRQRAEPVFGGEQARVAGELLLELDKRNEAVRALVWALACDGASPPLAQTLASLLPSAAQKSAAWVLARAAELARVPAAPAPFLSSLPKLSALASLHEQTARELAARGLPRTAGELLAERDRLVGWIGLPPLSPPQPPAVAVGQPFDAAPRALGHEGWDESGLTGFEERRVAGLWYADEAGDLHVGREKPRTDTNRFDRGAAQRDAFVLSRAWQLPGAWRFHAHVQFTTSFASGALVLGYTRRDQNLRLDFSAGDFMYAIGEADVEPTFDALSWGFHGLYMREGPLSGSQSGGKLTFAKPKSSFEVEVLVSGATAHLFLDGELLASYHTVDGAPIEGRIGFATGMGAIRVVQPSVQRLDRAAAAGLAERVPIGLDLERHRSCAFPELANRDVVGLPGASNGTVVLWLPDKAGEGEGAAQSTSTLRRHIERLAQSLGRRGAPQELVVALPASMGAEARAELASALAESLERPPRLIEHALAPVPTPEGPTAPDLDRRWVLFVDSAGVARVVAPYFTGTGGLEERLAHWLRVFQDHGQPPRELPTLVRGGAQDEEEGAGGR